MRTLIHDTLVSLANQEPAHHAKIRQDLYDRLELSSGKQFALYNCALGPASSGKLESHQDIDNAVSRALRLLETPER
ncbi:secretion protein [Vibrio sp. SM6]|uniref:Secretion protein n=1 Tax=Vibrio agarilyticus TaxID=2726741 RepID=A0A7X8TPD5_9VIBR|nr:PAS factor family protein [Vibrio agarilyticus]NLS12507.1 secretion protein [Vibrio agarilyticus]